jgi:hypothetical protein
VAIYKHPKSGVYFADVTVDKVRHRASLELGNGRMHSGCTKSSRPGLFRASSLVPLEEAASQTSHSRRRSPSISRNALVASPNEQVRSTANAPSPSWNS